MSGEGAEGLTVSSDTTNIAARLEQSAAAGEILIGARTRVLGGDAIEVEELEPLVLKGKADPVPAFRLVRVLPNVSPFERREDVPLVGRRHDLGILQGALRRATVNAECVLATVVGAAGVGKSRLAREFLAELGDSVRVLIGRCAPYGEGITFLPLAEALRPVLGADARAAVLELVADDERREAIADGVAGAFGADPVSGSGEETSWAFRRLFEALARERPLVLVVDDIHWAEETLLDLLEYVASFSSGARIVILCLTRPELLEERPAWSVAASERRSRRADTPRRRRVGHARRASEPGARPRRRRPPPHRRRRGRKPFLPRAAAGAEQRRGEGRGARHPADDPGAARGTDRPSRGSRAQSAPGRGGRRAGVSPLRARSVAADGHARRCRDDPALARPAPAHSASAPIELDGEAFSFAHALVREAAYAETPKETRADLHLRLADYLARDPSGPAEIVGYHLADATGYRLELGLRDEKTTEIAARGARAAGDPWTSCDRVRRRSCGGEAPRARLRAGAHRRSFRSGSPPRARDAPWPDPAAWNPRGRRCRRS